MIFKKKLIFCFGSDLSLKVAIAIMLGSIHNIRFADRWRERKAPLEGVRSVEKNSRTKKQLERVRVWGMVKINKTLIPKDEQVMHTSSHIVHDTFLIRIQSQNGNAHRTDQFCSSACLYMVLLMFQLAEKGHTYNIVYRRLWLVIIYMFRNTAKASQIST